MRLVCASLREAPNGGRLSADGLPMNGIGGWSTGFSRGGGAGALAGVLMGAVIVT
ncbi:Unknown protein sequence [Pseudomonas coronafaciens pv. oryzae]|nr:Unknown protein sequence [Pseudomonas coronafaciens pv. oryzae]